MPGFYETLEEQVILGFTGKINIQDKATSENIAAILFYEGEIINAQYRAQKEFKALMRIFVEVKINQELKFIVEPELLEKKNQKIRMSFDDIKVEAMQAVAKYLETIDEKPPEDLILKIKPEFIIEGEDIDENEYELLCAITNHEKVKDIYSHCSLYEHEITDAFISLRKKEAIKVIKTEG